MGIIDELVGELEDSDAITQNFGKWLILLTNLVNLKFPSFLTIKSFYKI